MLRTALVSVMAVMALACPVALAERRDLPVTPAVKAFVGSAAMRYARVTCASRYAYNTETPVTAGSFSGLYGQLVGMFAPMKARGLKFESGRGGSHFWALIGDRRDAQLFYSELRGGAAHNYSCSTRP